MLKKFFLNFLSSFAGAWVALALFGVIIVVVLIGILAKFSIANLAESQVKINKGTIMQIDLRGEIVENESAESFDVMTLLINGEMPGRAQSLSTILKALELAAENKNIEAVYLRCEQAIAGPATMHSLREGLLKFKEKAPGKKLYAFGNGYTQGDYYLASVADSIFLDPLGSVELVGLANQIPFFKDFFDKVGIDVQIAKVGTYKSAVEPYILTGMSEPARTQLDTLDTAMWGCILNGFAASRGISAERMNTMIDNDLPMFNSSSFALENKIVDALCYETDMNKRLAKIAGKEKYSDVNIVSPGDVTSSSGTLNIGARNQVAVLYACGEISEQTQSGINCYSLVPVIEELKDNKDVKALVMRVNSPGGSVFGSEQIWYALEQFKESGKPFVVSMGDYAASGGYYISCGADKIYADSLTITGSIGIFGMLPNIAGLTNKLGINFDLEATNPEAIVSIPLKPLTEHQMAAMQANVERGYDLFTGRVATGRGMSQDSVKRIGEGRVWSAITALEIGLVDELGSLEDAVKYAAEKAGIANDYNRSNYPHHEHGFLYYMPAGITTHLQQLHEQRSGYLHTLFGDDFQPAVYEALQRMLYRYPIQALMTEVNVKL